MKKGKAPSNQTALLTIIACIAVIIAITGYLLRVTLARPAQCPTDAKICGDGTAVGRTGPRCEFAPCPIADSAPKVNKLTGVYSCLKSKDPAASASAECSYGIETDAGDLYLIDTSSLSESVVSNLKIGDTITVEGTIVPIELLSTDKWRNYGLKGIMSVTKIMIYNHE